MVCEAEQLWRRYWKVFTFAIYIWLPKIKQINPLWNCRIFVLITVKNRTFHIWFFLRCMILIRENFKLIKFSWIFRNWYDQSASWSVLYLWIRRDLNRLNKSIEMLSKFIQSYMRASSRPCSPTKSFYIAGQLQRKRGWFSRLGEVRCCARIQRCSGGHPPERSGSHSWSSPFAREGTTGRNHIRAGVAVARDRRTCVCVDLVIAIATPACSQG